MKPREFDNIAIVLTSPFMIFMQAMARILKKEYGSKIHLYCHGPDYVDYFQKQNTDGTFDTIQDYWLFHKHFRDKDWPDAPAIYAKSRGYEKKYNMTVAQMAMGSTFWGYQFALAGYFVPRLPVNVETNYEQMLHLYNLNFDFWEKEFKEKNITLVLGGASVPNEVMIAAEAHGIPMRAATVSRFGNLHYWARNRYFGTPDIARVYPTIENPDPTVAEKLNSYLLYHIGSTQFLEDNTSIVRLLRNMFWFTAEFVYKQFKTKSRNRNLYYWEMIGSYLRIRRAFQRFLKLPMSQPEDLENESYVFFPLQVEPESSMGMMSPEFFTQQFAVAMVARDLPAGTKLVIKEHYVACGRRPPKFFQQMLDLKNLKLADPRRQGLEYIKNAKAVVTFSGTPGFEAAIMGIPVVTFCRHNLYNIIPHVNVVEDPAELTGMMKRIFEEPFDVEKAKRDGARFLEAVIRTSHDLRKFNQVDGHSFDQESVRDSINALIESFDDPQPVKLSKAG